MSVPDKEWRLTALTDVWTGDANGKEQRTVTTGLLGSIRWWLEVLVRGLGGAACDPADPNNRCPDRQDKRCVVCELFGCTGWARKFRFAVLDGNGEVMVAQIKHGSEFAVRFTPLRAVTAEEWALLDTTLALIAGYGAIGGKTVLKPSDEPNRAHAWQHRDYGLIRVEQGAAQAPISQSQLAQYICDGRWRKSPQQDFVWASLANFWCVSGRYLSRQDTSGSTFNKLLGRRELKNQGQQLASNDSVSRWLAGSRQESKKIFSFKNPPRTFGFAKPGTIELHDIKGRLRSVWPALSDPEFLTGARILDTLGSSQRVP